MATRPLIEVPAIVVSADSMQAYRGMDIGTAKPDGPLLALLPHRLIDFLGPAEQYSVGEFVRLAEAACRDIAASGGLPVLAGGTGFYVRAFVCGMPSSPAADPATRASVASDLAARGAEALREELRGVDPRSAERISLADIYRLTRALEIVRSTGRPLGDFAPPEAPRGDFDILLLGVERPRDELYARIEVRVDSMFEAGLAREFLGLYRSGFRERAPGMRAIGYREFFDLPAALFGLPAEAFERLPELDTVRQRIKQDSRRYAKRQMTYFRSLPGIRWMPPRADELASAISAFLAAR